MKRRLKSRKRTKPTGNNCKLYWICHDYRLLGQLNEQQAECETKLTNQEQIISRTKADLDALLKERGQNREKIFLTKEDLLDKDEEMRRQQRKINRIQTTISDVSYIWYDSVLILNLASKRSSLGWARETAKQAQSAKRRKGADWVRVGVNQAEAASSRKWIARR